MGLILRSFKDGFKKARKNARNKNGKKYTQESFAEAFGVSIDTVKNWEQGRTAPSIDTLIELCDFFECDIDYLFGTLDCKTHDIQFIHDKTGLSEEAIGRLIKWNEETKLPGSGFYHNSVLFISDLLECCGVQAAALAQNVSDCLLRRRISETENLTSKITEDIYNKYEIARMRASYKFFDCLEYIYKHSKNIPTKKSLQTAYPKTDEEKYWDDILGV